MTWFYLLDISYHTPVFYDFYIPKANKFDRFVLLPSNQVPGLSVQLESMSNNCCLLKVANLSDVFFCELLLNKDILLSSLIT